MHKARLLGVGLAAVVCVVCSISSVAMADIVIGTDTTTTTLPLITTSRIARTQVIYLASEIGGPFTFSALSLDLTRIPVRTRSPVR